MKRGDRQEIHAAARVPDPAVAPPPGEHGRELSASEAAAALHDALGSITVGTSPRITLSLKAFTTRRVIGRVLFDVTFTNGETVTVSLKAERFEACCRQLDAVRQR